jgi:hypothetical protein
MKQQPATPQRPPTPFEPPATFDCAAVLFPARYADYVPTEPPAQAASHPGFGVLPTENGGRVVWALR